LALGGAYFALWQRQLGEDAGGEGEEERRGSAAASGAPDRSRTELGVGR